MKYLLNNREKNLVLGQTVGGYWAFSLFVISTNNFKQLTIQEKCVYLLPDFLGVKVCNPKRYVLIRLLINMISMQNTHLSDTSIDNYKNIYLDIVKTIVLVNLERILELLL